MIAPIDKAMLSLKRRSLFSSGTQSKQRLPTGQRAESKGFSPHWSTYSTYYKAQGHCGRRGRQNVRVGDGEDKYGILSSRNGMVTAVMTHSSGAHLWETLHMTSRGARGSESSSE